MNEAPSVVSYVLGGQEKDSPESAGGHSMREGALEVPEEIPD